MTFIIDGSVLANAINAVTRVVGKGDGKDQKDSHVTMRGSVKNGTITLRGFSNNGRFVTHTVKPASIKENFAFGVPVDRLPAIVNKRSDLEFVVNAKSNTLQYKSVKGSYKGHIETLQQKTIDFPEPVGVETIR